MSTDHAGISQFTPAQIDRINTMLARDVRGSKQEIDTMTTSSNRKIARAYIADREGVERVRIMSNGEVHAYGTMPNTDRIGWYLAGDVDRLADMAAAEECND